MPVVVINDLYQDWKGKVRFRILRGGKPLDGTIPPLRSGALGQTTLSFSCTVPTEPGDYQLEAALLQAARSRCAACVISRWARRGTIRRKGLPGANPS